MTSLLLASCLVVPAAPTIEQVTPSGLRDLSFVVRIESGKQKELAKINSDFAQSYKFITTTVRLKEPFMMRLEAEVDDSKIYFIINGTKKLIRVPRSNLNVPQDLSKSPGKRQTILDFGLIAPSLFSSLYDAKYVRQDRASGDYVFDLTYLPALKDGTRQRVWIDPETKFTRKREWYSQIDGRLMATFTYEDPKKVGNLYIPTKLVVRNADNVVAGVSRYENIQLNQGISDDMFKAR